MGIEGPGARSLASRTLDSLCDIEHCVVPMDDSEQLRTLCCPVLRAEGLTRAGEYEELLPKLTRCLEFIRAGLAAGRGVLVHCHAGKSRSAAVVVAWMMAAAKLPYHEALAALRNQ